MHLSTLQSSVVGPDVVTSGSCRDITLCLLQLFIGGQDVATSLLLSRHSPYIFVYCTGCDSCRDINFLVATSAPGTMPFEQVTPVVVTSAHDFEVFSLAPLDVTTSAFSLPVSHVVLGVATSVFLS